MTEIRKRTYKTKEEKIAGYKRQVENYKNKIADLEKKIADLEKPNITLRDVTKAIKNKGIAPEQVIKMLETMDIQQE